MTPAGPAAAGRLPAVADPTASTARPALSPSSGGLAGVGLSGGPEAIAARRLAMLRAFAQGEGANPDGDLLIRLVGYLPPAGLAAMRDAVRLAVIAHTGQPRHAGGPYHRHVIEVGESLARLQLDAETIAAGVLHDVVEDTPVTCEDLREHFGPRVADMVEGVTKLGVIKYARTESLPEERAQRNAPTPELSKAAQQALNFQKLILASLADPRVLLIKLCDRQHNMQTLDRLPKQASQQRIASETLDIYAPLARRIGLYEIATDLENKAFAILNRTAYDAINQRLLTLHATYEDLRQRVETELRAELSTAGIFPDIKQRLKQPYSIHQKMERKRVPFDDLGDVVAFRLILETPEQCYRALGIIHRRWKCLNERFRDYISLPKPNGYQSLHTTVIGPSNQRLEVQMRTYQMDDEAERGVAAHWSYKAATYASPPADGHPAADPSQWLKAFGTLHQEGGTAEDMVELARFGVSVDEICVFTPRGDIKAIQRNALPLDFAYMIHEDIGNRAIGVRINGLDASLRTPLNNGDKVEIILSKVEAVQPNWESLVTTPAAKRKVRRFIERRHRRETEGLGRSILENAIRAAGRNPLDVNLEELARTVSHEASVADLCFKIGQEGSEAARAVLRTVFHDVAFPDSPDSDRPLTPVDRAHARILVAGRDLTAGVSLTFAPCCAPLPGDRIVGIHQPGRGVDVHTIACPRLEVFEDQPERWVDLRWTPTQDGSTLGTARVLITAANRRGVLAKLCEAVAQAGGNIVNVATPRRDRDFTDIHLDIEVHDLKHITDILSQVRLLSEVERAERRQDA